jgi:hypothetical protein
MKNKKLYQNSPTFKLFPQKKDNCWQISLCNYFNLIPEKVPHFVKLYGEDFVVETHKWLLKMNKGMVYVPFASFLETGTKYNKNLYPSGKCIALLEAPTSVAAHACLMVDGILLEKHSNDYSKIYGYFIIYDL